MPQPIHPDRLAQVLDELKAAIAEAVPDDVAPEDRPAYLRGYYDAVDWIANVVRGAARPNR